MTPTLSVDALQASDTLVAVLPVDRRPDGAVGASVSSPGPGSPEPSQDAPLTVQPVNQPEPLPPNPKLVRRLPRSYRSSPRW